MSLYPFASLGNTLAPTGSVALPLLCATSAWEGLFPWSLACRLLKSLPSPVSPSPEDPRVEVLGDPAFLCPGPTEAVYGVIPQSPPLDCDLSENTVMAAFVHPVFQDPAASSLVLSFPSSHLCVTSKCSQNRAHHRRLGLTGALGTGRATLL